MPGVNGINAVDNAARLANDGGRLADQLIGASRVGGSGVVNTAELAAKVAALGSSNPQQAARLTGEINSRLAPADQGRFQADLRSELASRNLPPQGGDAATVRARRDLALDVTQMALDIAGLFDPTPVSDGANAVISLFRGDFLGAGLSAVSIIPYLGDAAKAGKLGKWAQTIERAVDLAKTDSAFARTVGPQLNRLKAALDDVGDATLSKLPQPVQDTFTRMRGKLAEFAPLPARMSRAEFDALPAISGPGRHVKPSGGAWANPPNFDKWTDRGGKILANADGSYTYIRKDLVQVRYNAQGYPDFAPHLDHPSGVRSVDVPATRDRTADFRAANQAAGHPEWGSQSPPDYTWHHHESGTYIQLVPRHIHGGDAVNPKFSHAGGVANTPPAP